VLDIVSTSDGRVSELYSSPGDIGRPVWLSDGKSLLVPHFDQALHRSQLWSISLARGEARPFTQDLAEYTFYLDITRDRRTATTIATRLLSNIWVAPASDPSQARQVTSDDFPLISVAEAFDGKLLTVGGGSFREGQHGGLWIMNADGSQRTRFTEVQDAAWISPCGRFVVFTSYESGKVNLMRVDRDGTHSTRLASGNLWGSVCSPDGKFVFYASIEQPQKIWKVPIEGGDSVKVDDVVADQLDGRLAISPDGKLLAYEYIQYGHVPSEGWSLAVIPVEGGPAVKSIKLPSVVAQLQWSFDGKSLQYIWMKNGASNIWEQRLTGARPRQLTKFTSEEIFDFGWSPDHSKLLLARGNVSSDVVLINHLP
jgi:Tol biopolymer transport system component